MRQRLSKIATACAIAFTLCATSLPTAAVAAESPTVDAAAVAAPSGWNVVEKPITPHVAKVTVALVAPQGTTPNFTVEQARKGVEGANTFFSRETDGALTIELERVVDWQYVDTDIPCSWTGDLQNWVQPRIGWQRGAGKHLIVMVPTGSPCPNWANGEQQGSINSGGRTYQPGPDSYTIVHELGHNMSQFHAASVSCSAAWDFSTIGPGVPSGCSRNEYGNRLDVMGAGWTLNPYPAATLNRVGMLPRRFEPSCGETRSLDLTKAGAGAQGREVVSFADPRNPSARYWVDFRAKTDAAIYDNLHSSQFAFNPNRDGVQITRNDPNQWSGPAVISRPGDGNDHRQLLAVGERVALGGGAWVEFKGTTTSGEGSVDVFLPCSFETTMVAQHSNLCLDNSTTDAGGSTHPTQNTCGTASVQKYAFIEVPGAADVYTIVNRQTLTCLDIAGNSGSNGADVLHYPCSGTTNQQFTLRAQTFTGATANDFQVVSRSSSKCVDVTSGSTDIGADLLQWTCASPSSGTTKNQVWRLAGA